MEVPTNTPRGSDAPAPADHGHGVVPPDLHDPTQRAAVERSISSIPDVLGARLVEGFDRQVDELHVLTSVSRSPKQTVRDVQSLLMARFAIPTDHRVISVVQLDEATTAMGLPRVAIHQVGLTQSGVAAAAEVILADGDERYVGTAEDAASAKGRRRAVASATLNAASTLVSENCRVALDGIDLIEVAGQRIAVCILHITAPHEEMDLAGSALVRDAEPDAVARAVLDALNRTISGTKPIRKQLIAR